MRHLLLQVFVPERVVALRAEVLPGVRVASVPSQTDDVEDHPSQLAAPRSGDQAAERTGRDVVGLPVLPDAVEQKRELREHRRSERACHLELPDALDVRVDDDFGREAQPSHLVRDFLGGRPQEVGVVRRSRLSQTVDGRHADAVHERLQQSEPVVELGAGAGFIAVPPTESLRS